MKADALSFSLSALLGAMGDNVPRERFQDPKLQQNKNGSWFIRPWVDVITANGRKRQKKVIVLGAATIGKRAAQAAKTQVMSTINRATYVLQSQISFADLLTEFEREHTRRLSVPTQLKYESLMKVHIIPAWSGMKLIEVTGQRIQQWLDAKSIAGTPEYKAWSTRADLRNLMSAVFTFARSHKFWQEANPLEHVTAGRKRLEREKRKLTDDQTRQLLAALPPMIRSMACVALFCGLRISEVLGLQEKHIDFSRGDLSVEQRYHRGNLDSTKNRKAERKVPLGYLADELRLLMVGAPERFVFGYQTGNSLMCRDDRDLQRRFLRPAAQKVGCYYPGFGWHSLRREAVTAFNASLGVTQAMQLAGHSTIEMSGVYTLADRVAQDAAVRERQERLMGSTKGVQ